MKKLLKQTRLRLNPHYIVETVEPDEVFLLSEEEKKILRGPLYFSIADALQEGPLSEDDLVEKLSGSIPLAEVYYALYQLRDKGYIADEVEEEGLAAFCHYLNVPYRQAKEALAGICYQIHSLSKQPIDLSSLPCQEVSSSSRANLTLLVVDDYLDERIGPLVNRFLDEGGACLLFKPSGKYAWLGPVLTPENRVCFSCLKFWMDWNHLEESFIKDRRGESEKLFVPKATFDTTRRLATGWFELELLKWMVGYEGSFLEKGVVTFDMVKNEQENHHLNQWTQCPSCQQEGEALLEPIELKSRKKGSEKDGGHHSVSPQETIERYGSLVSPITGIIPALQKMSVAEDLHAYAASHHNFSVKGGLGKFGIEHFRQIAGGKGKTELQAKASALGEGIERHCGIFQGHEPHIVAAFEEIERGAVDLRDCLFFSEAQYQNRDKNNAECDAFHHVPVPFDSKKKIKWSPLWSLSEKRWKYLPTHYCYFMNGFSKKDGAIHECIGDSNGCAAGNTHEEAILQGFFELVERDCVAIWWYNQISMPEIDLDAMDDPYVKRVQAQYAAMGRQIYVLDITNDLGIPTFVSCSTKEGGDSLLFGFGTSSDPQIALFRAITEMSQMMILEKKVKKTIENETAKPDSLTLWLQNETVKTQPQFMPSGKKRLDECLNRGTDDLKEDILLCQSIVEDKGMEMLVLDQTRPEIGMPVVRVVVPGLRHFWPRFAPGRLYDVPVQMGWLEKPKTENTLNSTPVMI